MKAVCLTALCLASPLVLQGCVGVAVSGSTYAIKASDRPALQARAAQGDVEAEYLLGKSWCCMGPGFDTQTATQWFCQAAGHGHAGAMYELGRIYDGDVSRTPAPGQKLVRLLTADSSPAHALAFFNLAARQGHAESASRATELNQTADDATRRQAGLIEADSAAQCQYEVVFPKP